MVLTLSKNVTPVKWHGLSRESPAKFSVYGITNSKGGKEMKAIKLTEKQAIMISERIVEGLLGLRFNKKGLLLTYYGVKTPEGCGRSIAEIVSEELEVL